VLGVLVLDETVSMEAFMGIGAIILGIFTIHWWGKFSEILGNPTKILRDPGTRYALLTGLLIATYSVWDKIGVGHVNPFLYMYGMTVGTAVFLTPYMLRTHGARVLKVEWTQAKMAIVVSGLLTFLAYGLVLTALTTSKVSYVAPTREVGIVIGVLLGTLVLKEPFGGGRLVGSGLILTGLVFVALAP
jgi:uncharacterized membrane protein